MEEMRDQSPTQLALRRSPRVVVVLAMLEHIMQLVPIALCLSGVRRVVRCGHMAQGRPVVV